jgi:hypothetical protein
MGLTILRCGRPDIELWSRAEDGIPECSSFIYAGTAMQPHLVVHFVYLGDAGWVFSSFPLCIVGRGEINAGYQSVENTLTNFIKLEEDMAAIDGYSDKNRAERYASDIHTSISPLLEWNSNSIAFILQNDLSSLRAKQLKFDIAPLTFLGQNQKNELDLIYQINAAQLSFKNTATSREAGITKTIRFFKPDWSLLDEIKQDKSIAVPHSVQTIQQKDYLGIIPLYFLTAGQYIVEMEIQDELSKKVGVVRRLVNIPDYSSGRLAMSDILLCSSGHEKKSDFKRGRLNYHPRHMTPYDPAEMITAYIEIYNLTQDSTGYSGYTLDVGIKTFDDRSDKATVKLFTVFGADLNAMVNDTTIGLHRPMSNDILYLKLKRGDILPGNYELTIHIRDELSGAVVQRHTAFVVQ